MTQYEGAYYFEMLKDQKYYVEISFPKRSFKQYFQTIQDAEQFGDILQTLTIHTIDGFLCAQRGTLQDKFIWLNL